MIDAARILKERNVPVRIVLAGTPDAGNPGSVPEATIQGWVDEGLVEWRGHVDDMPSLWAASHVGVLPTTYGEGIPKCLIEAAACGRPVIASDWTGCRDLVLHGKTGLLVPPTDEGALADAIALLAVDAGMRRRMGAEARAEVERSYCSGQIIQSTLDIYKQLLKMSSSEVSSI